MYIVKTVEETFCFSQIEPVSITHHPFGGGYCPNTECRLCYVKNKGFALRMVCEEKNPIARFTHADEPVFKDSCMEFFADFYPGSDIGYINFEMNAKGVLLCMLGPSRDRRLYVRDIGVAPPQPVAVQEENAWSVELFIPLEFTKQIYGRCDFTAGSIIKGNFYKCGDMTGDPHWGCWYPLGKNPVDFHQPETFGDLVID